MSARSSSSRYTAASSAGARPTSRFSASTGTKPFSSSSSRAAEYLAAQPPPTVSPVSAVTAPWYEDGGQGRRLLGERREPRGTLASVFAFRQPLPPDKQCI